MQRLAIFGRQYPAVLPASVFRGLLHVEHRRMLGAVPKRSGRRSPTRAKCRSGNLQRQAYRLNRRLVIHPAPYPITYDMRPVSYTPLSAEQIATVTKFLEAIPDDRGTPARK